MVPMLSFEKRSGDRSGIINACSGREKTDVAFGDWPKHSEKKTLELNFSTASLAGGVNHAQ
jgi:hypothetical protein